MKRAFMAAVASLLFASSLAVAEESKFAAKPLAEKKVDDLPAGQLFWRIETFSSKEQAQAAATSTALVAEAEGKVWLFTLGPQGHASAGGATIAEVGPIQSVKAKHYLLRINEGSGPPGSITPVHTHPGSETFYVLAGETSQKTAYGTSRVGAGQSMAGHGPNTPMQVSSSGTTGLQSLVMFVVDADAPFSSPAKFESANSAAD